MTFRAGASLGPLLCACFLALPAAAQDRVAHNPLIAGTCGWPPFEAEPVPAVLARIEQRLGDIEGYVAETARDGLSELKRWVRDCNETASRQAVLELRRALDRAPSHPGLQAALGVALARGIEVQPPGAHGHNFRPAYPLSNAEREARRLLSQALDQWPDADLGLELAALALATRHEESLDVAAVALETLAAALPADARIRTVRAEVAIARLDYDVAAHAAGEAAELGDPSGFWALGVTRLLCDEDPAEGGRMYLAGLASADEGALYRYHEDLAPLLLLEEERQWAALEGAARKAWLREEWEWRASTAGRTLPERLAVHFARLETAMLSYRRMAHRGARPVEAIVWDSLQIRFPFDDRGLIHIRHGQPDDIVRVPSGRMGPGKEAWLYHQLAGGRAVFEFRKLKDWADWVLAAPAECDPFVYMYGIGGAAGEARYVRNDSTDPGWEAAFERGVFDYGTSLAVADPALAMNAVWCYTIVRAWPYPDGTRKPGQRVTRLLQELPYIRLREAMRRRDARTDVEEALATETAVPRFERFVPALSSVYVFRGSAGAADVAAFLLLPAGGLTPRPLERGVAYPLRLSLAVEDNDAHRVQRTDTLLTFAAQERLAAGQFLRTGLQLRAEPVADATVRITVVNPDHPEEGQILVGTRTVPAYPASRLAMSDLVIADPEQGSWRRGGVSISPLPGHQLRADGVFRLFYEVYGVKAEETVRTRITVAPGTDPDLLSRLKSLFGDQRVLELSFQESAQPGADGVLQVERTITPSLEPGRYTLEVTVERPSSGESATMRTSILLLQKGGG